MFNEREEKQKENRPKRMSFFSRNTKIVLCNISIFGIKICMHEIDKKMWQNCYCVCDYFVDINH